MVQGIVKIADTEDSTQHHQIISVWTEIMYDKIIGLYYSEENVTGEPYMKFL